MPPAGVSVLYMCWPLTLYQLVQGILLYNHYHLPPLIHPHVTFNTHVASGAVLGRNRLGPHYLSNVQPFPNVTTSTLFTTPRRSETKESIEENRSTVTRKCCWPAEPRSPPLTRLCPQTQTLDTWRNTFTASKATKRAGCFSGRSCLSARLAHISRQGCSQR